MSDSKAAGQPGVSNEWEDSGGRCGDRTCDLRLVRAALWTSWAKRPGEYNYWIVERETRIELATFSLGSALNEWIMLNIERLGWFRSRILSKYLLHGNHYSNHTKLSVSDINIIKWEYTTKSFCYKIAKIKKPDTFSISGSKVSINLITDSIIYV